MRREIVWVSRVNIYFSQIESTLDSKPTSSGRVNIEGNEVKLRWWEVHRSENIVYFSRVNTPETEVSRAVAGGRIISKSADLSCLEGYFGKVEGVFCDVQQKRLHAAACPHHVNQPENHTSGLLDVWKEICT